MISDDGKINTIEEMKNEVSNRLNHMKQCMTQIFSGLAYMLPNAIEQVLPYSNDIKDFNKFVYFGIIVLHVSFTAYFAYKTMKTTQIKEVIKEEEKKDAINVN